MSKGRAQTTSRIRFKPYPTYKDSGVEWLGEIPAAWEVAKFSWCYRLGMGETLIKEDLLQKAKRQCSRRLRGTTCSGTLTASRGPFCRKAT